jgi:hypothetical protein
MRAHKSSFIIAAGAYEGKTGTNEAPGQPDISILG